MKSIVIEQKFKTIDDSGQEFLVTTQEIKENYSVLDVFKKEIPNDNSQYNIVSTSEEYTFVDFESDIPVFVTIMQGLSSWYSGTTTKYTAIREAVTGTFVIQVTNSNDSKKANVSVILAKKV